MDPAVDRHAPLSVRLIARETAGFARIAEPVTIGVPLPRGRVREAGHLRLRSTEGDAIPLQVKAQDHWSDGSIRWVLLDFAAGAPSRGEAEFFLTVDDGPPAPDGPEIKANKTGDGLFVDTGAAAFLMARGPFDPFRSVRADGVEMLDPAGTGWVCVDRAGHSWNPVATRVALETAGPLRTTVRVDGEFWGPGDPLLHFTARITLHAGRAAAKLEIAVTNPRRAAHPGGHWELGDPGSVFLRELSLCIASRKAGRASWSADCGAPLSEVPGGSVGILQDGSGGKNRRSRVHQDHEGRIPVGLEGYRVRMGSEAREGLRASPRLAVHDGSAGVSASMRYFWQEFPKDMRAEADGTLRIGLFPERPGAFHEIQGGERKRHEVRLFFGEEALAPANDAARAPLFVHADPKWYASTEAIPYLTTRAEDTDADCLRLVDQAIEGDSSFEAKREAADEFGWRHFGEIPADHEAHFHKGDETFVSHYNNQYDAVDGAFLRFAGSGDIRWFRIMEELARHVMDIDLYHTDRDRSAYNHGLFWHTVHYVDAGKSTHRSYPSVGSAGGGPDNEHNYTTGLLHYHLLTGDELAREAVLGSAQWVVDADDGAKTMLRVLDRGDTGLATKTRDFGYHGPGRGAGNSINALVDGWRLGGDPDLLARCETLIRRSIHPEDNMEARDLLNAENRWSYTVYLQALGKYLDAKAETGQLDSAYTYARESLLAYARWMAAHEHPILDKPGQLEYPNETWPAQDIRKSDVFCYAALHANDAERESFVERARFFFRSAVESVDSFPTRGYARPVILLMKNGLMHPWWRLHPDVHRPQGLTTGPFGEPEQFVPQKTRALRKLRWIAAAGAVLLLAGGGATLLRVLS
ncbi:MAG: hypothetical protein QF904_08210 [Gemmatimonadota bacterium]|nr:hypothetical protein [Gemmatimonadota bacterium]